MCNEGIHQQVHCYSKNYVHYKFGALGERPTHNCKRCSGVCPLTNIIKSGNERARRVEDVVWKNVKNRKGQEECFLE